MRRRCSLCGGKLNGNICTECGLDNSKNDDQYVTLGNSDHEAELTHVHTEEEKPYEGKTMTRDNVRKAQNVEKNAKKAAVKNASKNAATGNQSYSYTASSMPQSSRPVKKKRKFGKFLVGCVIIAAFAGELAGTISEEIRNYFDEYTYDDSDSYNEDDPYSAVQDVMPEDGAVYETELTAGIYKGAVQIPQGTYSVNYVDGNGYVELIDNKNGIWESYYFGDAYEDTVDGVDDFRVYPGTYVVIYDGVTLNFATENAQDAFEKMNNPEEGVWNLADNFIVGEDLPAGVYDITCTNGGGDLFSYTAVDSSGYETNLGMPFGNNSGDYIKELKNIVLTEGTEVDMEGIEAEFVPSKEIESEDYNSFYDNFY